MRKNITRSLIIGGAASLASLVNSCGNNPGTFLDINSSNLPADNQYFGRQFSLFEGDIQETPDNSLSFALESRPEGIATGAIIYPLKDMDGRVPPFDVSWGGSVNAEDGSTDWQLYFSDNNTPFQNGEMWTVRIVGLDQRGHVERAIEDVHITYNRGQSNENLTDRVDEIDSNGVTPEQPSAPGNGVCERPYENLDNSQGDCGDCLTGEDCPPERYSCNTNRDVVRIGYECVNPSSPASACRRLENVVVDDCDNGCSDGACLPETPEPTNAELYSQVRVNITDAEGNVYNELSVGAQITAYVTTEMPALLEQRVGGPATSAYELGNLGPVGPANCYGVVGNGQSTRVGESNDIVTYRMPFDIAVQSFDSNGDGILEPCDPDQMMELLEGKSDFPGYTGTAQVVAYRN